MAEIAPQDNTALIQTILGAVSGKSSNTTGSSGTTSSGTTGSTTTTKGNISKEGIDAMIQEILSQAGSGVADIATGAASTGLYNSTTQGILTGNLVAKTAGELAKAQAGTTTESTGTQSQTGTTNNTSNTTAESPLRNVDLSALAGAGGLGLLAQLLGPTLQGGVNAATGGLGLGGLGNAIRDAIFGSGSMIGPNQTGGSGIGQIGQSQLTPRQIEALLNKTGGFDLSSFIDPNVGGADFWESIGIDPADLQIDNSGDSGDWWDPSWGG